MSTPKLKKKRKKLFIKIFTINLLIILIAFIIMSAICYARINSYLKNEQVSSILTASSRVYDITERMGALIKDLESQNIPEQASPEIRQYYKKLSGQIEEGYRNTLALIATSTDFSVMQITPDGKIIYRYADIKNFTPGTIELSRPGTHDPETINCPEVFSDMLNGKFPSYVSLTEYNGEEYFITWGNMGKMFTDTTLTVMKPLYENKEITSTIVLFIPTPQINLLLRVITSNFLLAAIISLFISTLLSYAITFRIAKPLKEMNNVAMKLASGDFTRRVNADTNSIGEIEELIKTFNDMAEAIENSEENQRAFTASIAHELRTPMTSIIGFIDSILDGTIPKEKSAEYLNICLSEARRLSKLTTELMDISRIESGNTKLDIEPFDINECIRRQIIKYQDRISEKNLNISVEFEEESCICLCDKDSITRVFINLIDNAIKFSDTDGYIKIDVSTKFGKALISIENSGTSIPENELKYVFDKFYKSDKSRSLDKNGIGLGLYLVKNILSLHGENITVTSTPGESTVFRFSLKNHKNH